MIEVQKNVIALPQDITLTSVLAIQALINEETSKECAIQLDAKDVDRFDGASLQLLIAFAQSDLAFVPAITNENDLLRAGFKDIGTEQAIMTQLFESDSEQLSSAE